MLRIAGQSTKPAIAPALIESVGSTWCRLSRCRRISVTVYGLPRCSCLMLKAVPGGGTGEVPACDWSSSHKIDDRLLCMAPADECPVVRRERYPLEDSPYSDMACDLRRMTRGSSLFVAP